MTKIISKNKPKGTEYNKLKKMKKAKRIQKLKDDRRRAENKRINAENRKEKRIEKEFLDKISSIEIIDFSKGMLLLKISETIEKRALIFKRRENDIKDFLDFIDEFELKLFGENVQLRKLSNFNEVKDELVLKIKNNL